MFTSSSARRRSSKPRSRSEHSSHGSKVLIKMRSPPEAVLYRCGSGEFPGSRGQRNETMNNAAEINELGVALLPAACEL